jgi:hypothetical protein
MEEALITFETAKLAKEKGFDEKVYREYDKSGYLRCTSKSADVVLGPYDELLKSTEFPAPTQSLLSKWLREVHNIHITLFPQDEEDLSKTWTSKLYTLNYGSDAEVSYLQHGGTKLTYEEALEIGLFQALLMI